MTTNTRFFDTKDQYLAFREKWRYAARHGFPLTGAHHVLYNIIRGRDPQHGFTPFQRRSKIEGMGIINRGAYMAWEALKFIKSDAVTYDKYSKRRVDEFLAPFGDTFTAKDLAAITLPHVEPIDANYGKGRMLAEKMFNGAIKPRTCIELMKEYNSLERPPMNPKSAKKPSPSWYKTEVA